MIREISVETEEDPPGLGERGAFLPVRNRHAGDNDEGADYLECPQLFL